MKKPLALLQILLTITMSLAFSFTPALAEQVCCEQTTSGDFCQYTDQTQCAPGAAFAATSCDQTSFCKPGCCVDQDGDGYCYGNYAKATCEQEFNGKFTDDPTCEQTLECAEGCCVIGTQAAYVTEARCKAETANYPDLSMDFRSDITSEAACLEVARTAEKGACLTESGCTYTTRANCQTEFHTDTYCSELPQTNCAPANPALGGTGDAQNTGCLENEDDVYWIDSCGNPEGIREQCSYIQGTLCGDANQDGEYRCESLNCENNQELSIYLESEYGETTANVDNGGVLNGESWCLYDSYQENNPIANDNFDTTEYHARDLVGSRYYRSLCIAGQELVEPCADYRAEYCIADEATLPQGNVPFAQAGCIENRWDSCLSECNTADSLTQEPIEFRKNVEEDQTCCADVTRRDCAWVGKCVPKVAPGFKFWEDEGSNVCEQASLGCPMVVRCPGWQRLFTGGKCGGADGWQVLDTNGDGVPDAECLSEDFKQAANNLCRSVGDCGAHYNIKGKLSEDAFSVTETFGDEFDRSLKNDIEKFNQAGGYVLDVRGERVDMEFTSGQEIPGKFEQGPDWDKGSYFFSYQEPEDKRGKWRLLLGPQVGPRREAGTPGPADIGSFLVNTGTVAAILTFGIMGNTGAYSNLPKGSGNIITNTFFGPLISSLGDTEDVRNAKKEDKNARNTQAGTLKQLSGILSPGTLQALTKKAPQQQSDQLTGIVDSGMYKGEDLDKLKSAQGATDKVVDTGKELETAQAGVDQTKQAGKGIQQGINIAAWVYMIYKVVNVLNEKVQTITVDAQCKPYVAPATTDQCEQCNQDYKDYVDNNGKPTDINALKACSQYRCKSLGASCELINEGTDNELCVSLTQYDVTAPVIEPWIDGFEQQYQNSIQATAQGFTITQELPIYNNVDLALETDTPAQCKMDFKHSQSYDDMPDYFFGSPNYEYYHAQTVFFPQGNEEQGLAFNQGGGEYTIYVRCKSANGVTNENDYSINLKISQEPDITAPIIETTSMGQNAFLTANATQTPITVMVNEQATCGWATNNVHFDSMTNLCTTDGPPNPQGTFECHFGGTSANAGPSIEGLTLNPGDEAYLHFKCKDNAGNANKESFQLTLRGTKELSIESFEPQGQIFTSLAQQNSTLKIITKNGANQNGQATCKYTNVAENAQTPSLMNLFLNSNTSIHTQPLILNAGAHDYFATCYDVAGNTAHAQTSFSIQADTYAPLIIRAYKDTTQVPATFKVKTNEQASCEYTTTDVFNFGEGNPLIEEPGNVHTAAGDSDMYYIICEDEYGNRGQPTVVSFIY